MTQLMKQQETQASDDPLHGFCALWRDGMWGNDSELISYAQLLEDFATELEEDRCPETTFGRVIQFYEGGYDDVTDTLIEQAQETLDIADYEHRYGRG